MFNEVPVWYMRKNVATIEMGIETADDHRAGEILQEEEQDDDGDYPTEQGVLHHLIDRGLDEARLVNPGLHLDPFRQLFLDRFEARLNRPGHRHGVGVPSPCTSPVRPLPSPPKRVITSRCLWLRTTSATSAMVTRRPSTLVNTVFHDVVEIAKFVAGADQIARLGLVQTATRLVDVLASAACR